MNPLIDDYLKDGCGRCSLFQTPKCKVHTWQKCLTLLRTIILETGLQEELKWSMPCYTYQGKTVVMMAAFKEYCCISFFKGSVLEDENGLLTKAGEHSKITRILKITDITTIVNHRAEIKSLIYQAIALEQSGVKVSKVTSKLEPWPQELTEICKSNPQLKSAFSALTPGRQRGYLLFFNGAKQSQTRINRIQKYIPLILQGKGMQD